MGDQVITAAVLFAREDSDYKKLPQLDVYDINRDATTFSGKMPVICHPPCRAWGRLSHWKRVKPRLGEKAAFHFSLFHARANGGIIEHPIGSKAWQLKGMPVGIFEDAYGGFFLDIDQYDFGHVARKATRLYICGIGRHELPPLPPANTATPLRSIAGNVANTTNCTTKQREATPAPLIKFLCEIIDRIEPTGDINEGSE